MGDEEAITFEYIRKVQREEQYETKLSKIPEDFYEKVRNYIEQKKKLIQKKRDKEGEMEIENIQKLLEEVYNRRETKILNQALISARTGIPPQNLIKNEEKLFNQILDILKFSREKTLKTSPKKIKEKEESGLKRVRFIKEIPEFVGVDLQKYGPYNEGEEAEIPKENAELMVNTGNAEWVEKE